MCTQVLLSVHCKRLSYTSGVYLAGGFAKVKLGIHKLTGEKVAVKIMNKRQLGVRLVKHV